MSRKVTGTPPKTGTTKTTRATKTTKKVVSEESNLLDDKRMNLLSQIKIDLKHKNEIQKKLTNSIKNGDVTICTGPAGTGKTLLSVAEALLLLKNHSDIFTHIKLVKSIVQLEDEDLGTLPGDEKDKLKFIMMSFIDAFNDLIGEELTNKLMEAGYIKMEVFGSMRGRSIANCILLFDEFQNVTDRKGKTFLTRFSKNTKVIALGDSNQIDIKKPETSCLKELVRMAKLYPENGVEIVEFTDEEIVRHRLTSYFIKIFEHVEYKPKGTEVKKEKHKEEYKKPSFFRYLLNYFK